MAEKTIRENFFDAKAIGSLWDVAVSLKRGNPLPIDADSVFESETKLIEYIGDKITTVAYPGQVVAVVNADSTQIFYIDQELNYHLLGARLDPDGRSIKVDNNVLKLVGFDEATDGLLAQVKVDAEGNRTLNWVSIETIAQGDGNTTYTFTGLDKQSNLYFEVKASDAETATKIYLDAYTKQEIDDKFAALVDNDTTYTFTNGIEGKFTVTPKDGTAVEVDTGAKAIVDALDKKVTDADYQNASQVSTAITTALTDYYNKEAIDGKVEDLEGKISAIPKFAIEVATAKEDGTPDVTTPSTTTVYLIPDNDTTTSDVYDEYIYVNGSWELLGKQTLDLTGYATETFVTDEIAKLTAENGAVKVVADKVTALEEAVGDSTDGLVKDVADLKAIDQDKLISDAIAEHNESKDHLTSDDVDKIVSNKYGSRLTDIENSISTLPTTEDIEEIDNSIAVKAVDTNEFNLSEDKTLSVNKISQDKITGLADTFNAINKNISDLDAYVGDIPADEKYADVTNVISYINKKAEETLAAANGGSSESAASVAQALETYKSENDPKVRKNTEDIASIVAKLDTIDENAQENIIEEIKLNGVALAITDKIVDIPAATTEKFGVIKLGSEFQTNEETDALEIKEVNVNKLVQTDGDVLILNGGLASNLATE